MKTCDGIFEAFLCIRNALRRDSSGLRLFRRDFIVLIVHRKTMEAPQSIEDNALEAKKNVPLEPSVIAKLVEDRDIEQIKAWGGLEGIAAKLETSLENGLSKLEVDSNFSVRRSKYPFNFV